MNAVTDRVLLLCALLLASAAGCPRHNHSSEAPRGTPMMTHHQLVRAVRATGDAEALAWVAEPDDYSFHAVQDVPLEHHLLLRVTPSHLSHPMHFLVAVDRASGDVFVVSGRPPALSTLLQREPDLAASEDLPRQAFELLTDAPDRSRLFDHVEDLPATVPEAVRAAFETPRAEQGVDGWELTFTVLDDADRLQVWRVSLPWQGEPTWKRTTLATLEDEGGP